MEHLARVSDPATVKGIAHQRVAEVFEVNADLMRASGVEGAFDQARIRQFAQDAVLGGGSSPSPGFHNGHFFAVDGVAGDFFFDHAGFFGEMPGSEREVFFQYIAPGELFGERLVGQVIFGDHEAAAGFFVESVHDAGALCAADARERGTMVEQRIDERAAGVARSGVHHHSGRFVEHQEIDVFKKDFQRNGFRLGAGDRHGLRFVDGNPFAGSQFFT